MDEGLSFSDIFDDSIPYEQKPPEMLRPMEETDFPTQAKDLFAGLWESDLLTETHLQDLFHATGESNLLQILKDDALKLAFAGGTEADLRLNKGYQFFLSTMRQKYGNYARDIGGKTGFIKNYVVIHLDGKALTAAGFKVFPVNYWGHGPEYSEQEERVVANKDEISPLKKFVRDIHVYIQPDLKHQLTIDRIHEVSNLAPQIGVKVYFYKPEDARYFKAQRTEKAVMDVNEILPPAKLSQDDLERKCGGAFRGGRHSVNNYLHSFMRIYNHDYSKVEEFPDSNVMKWLLWYPHDAISQLFCDAHNYKPYHILVFRDIVAAIKKEGLKTFKELIELVMKREQERYKKETELKEFEEMRECKKQVNEILGIEEVQDAIMPTWPDDPPELRFRKVQWYEADSIFIVYDKLVVGMEELPDKMVYFSNDSRVHEAMNIFDFMKFIIKPEDRQYQLTHDHLGKLVRNAVERTKYPIIKNLQTNDDWRFGDVAGRVWKFHNNAGDEKCVVGFWNNVENVRAHWKPIQWILEKLNVDWKVAEYTFSDRYTEKFSFSDMMDMNTRPDADEREVALRQMVHLSPQAKKGLLNLPPDRIQHYADRIGVPVAKLRHLLGSMDEMTTG